MAGKPAEHLKVSLKNHIDQLGEGKIVTLKSSRLHDPKEMENSGGMFTCFAEVEIEVETTKNLFEVILDYMPASVEVLEPTNNNIGSEELTGLLNNLAGRLHRYDEIARMAKFKIDHLMGQVNIATKVLEKNKLAKDGKLLPSAVKQLQEKEKKPSPKKKISKKK